MSLYIHPLHFLIIDILFFKDFFNMNVIEDILFVYTLVFITIVFIFLPVDILVFDIGEKAVF